MAAPNVVNVTNITGKTAVLDINNTSDSDLTILSGVGEKVLKVNIIRVANTHSTENDSVDINFVRSSTNYPLVKDMAINIRNALPALEGPLYLEENDALTMSRLNSSSLDSSTLVGIVSYEEIGDSSGY